jgi:acyl-coenzyme A thioesterase PaaI-like protein
MIDQPPAVAAFNTQMVRMTPQSSALGFEFVSSGPDGAALKVPYRADLVGDPASGVIAGGVITTLLDHVCGMAIGAAMGGTATAGQARMGGMATLDTFGSTTCARPSLSAT